MTMIKKRGAIVGLITQIAPFLFPGLFFESGLLLVLSPLPFFILTLKGPKNYSTYLVIALALFTNAAFVFSLQGKIPAFFALWLWVIIGILFPSLIKKASKIIRAFWISFLSGISIAAITITLMSGSVGAVNYVKNYVAFNFDQVAQLKDSPLKKIIEDQGRDEILKEINTELPSAFIISYILIFWLNMLFASRLIPGFLSKQFWTRYKNPEWMVWPTLASAAAFAFGEFAIHHIGLNIFKTLMCLYALQGLSIISFLLTKFKIQGFFRALVMSAAIFIAIPMVLVIGFFDLWFDFRKKIGQNI